MLKNDIKYSCDPVVNDYVVKNKDKFRNINREQLVSYPFHQQAAIWRSLSNLNKLNIYKEKIDKVIATESLNSAELELLTSLKGLSENIYNDPNPDILSDSIRIYCTNILGWSLDRYVTTLECFATATEMNNAYVTDYSTLSDEVLRPILDQGAAGDCNCYYSIACMWSGSPCVKTKCNVKQNCGLFGTTNCPGTCGGIVV